MRRPDQRKVVTAISVFLFLVWILVGTLGRFFLSPFCYEGQTVVFRGSLWGMSLVGICLVMLLCVSIILAVNHDGVYVSKWQLIGAVVVFAAAIVVYIIGVQIASREIRINREEILYYTLTKQVVVRKEDVIGVQIHPSDIVILTSERKVQIPMLFMQCNTANIYYDVMTALGYPTTIEVSP